MADDKKIVRTEQELIERRSIGSVVEQFLSGVPIGAGVTTGGLIAKDAYAKVKHTLKQTSSGNESNDAPAQESPRKD